MTDVPSFQRFIPFSLCKFLNSLLLPCNLRMQFTPACLSSLFLYCAVLRSHRHYMMEYHPDDFYSLPPALRRKVSLFGSSSLIFSLIFTSFFFVARGFKCRIVLPDLQQMYSTSPPSPLFRCCTLLAVNLTTGIYCFNVRRWGTWKSRQMCPGLCEPFHNMGVDLSAAVIFPLGNT